MAFSDLYGDVYAFRNESSSNSAFTAAQIKAYVNEGYKYICRQRNWDFLKTYSKDTLPFDNIASQASATNITFDSGTSFDAGMRIVVNDGVRFEDAVISSVASTPTMTLTSPGLTGTYADGDEVSGFSLTLPSDIWKLLSVSSEYLDSDEQSRQTLVRITQREFEVLIGYPKSTGQPLQYYISGSYAFFYPVPDKDYQIRWEYYKIPTTMSADADVPVIPAEYTYLITYYGLMKTYQKDENPKLAMYYKQEVEDGIAKMWADQSRIMDGTRDFKLGTDRVLPSFSW